jgi:hypothetical protein
VTARINCRRTDQLGLNVTGVTEVNEFNRAVEVDPRGKPRLAAPAWPK